MSDSKFAGFLHGFGLALAVGWAFGNGFSEVWAWPLMLISLSLILISYRIEDHAD